MCVRSKPNYQSEVYIKCFRTTQTPPTCSLLPTHNPFMPSDTPIVPRGLLQIPATPMLLITRCLGSVSSTSHGEMLSPYFPALPAPPSPSWALLSFSGELVGPYKAHHTPMGVIFGLLHVMKELQVAKIKWMSSL